MKRICIVLILGWVAWAQAELQLNGADLRVQSNQETLLGSVVLPGLKVDSSAAAANEAMHAESTD